MKLQLIVISLIIAGCTQVPQTDPATVKRCEPIWESGGWDSLEHCVNMQTQALAASSAQRRALGFE